MPPKEPVTNPEDDIFPVIVVAPAANVPVVDTPEVSRVRAPVVLILLSVTSTLPNVPPKEPVTNPEDDIFPVIVVAPAANVPVTLSVPPIVAFLVTDKPVPVPFVLLRVRVSEISEAPVTLSVPVIVVALAAKVPVVEIFSSPKLIFVPSVVIAPSLIVTFPNLEPEAPVIVPDTKVSPVTSNVPDIVTPSALLEDTMFNIPGLPVEPIEKAEALLSTTVNVEAAALAIRVGKFNCPVT